MRVIAGDGNGEDRFDPDGTLLRLAHAVANADNEHEVFRIAADGIAPLFEAACAAIVLSREDGTLRVAASSSDFGEYADAVHAARLPLSGDALAADAVLTGTYVIDREPFTEEQRSLIELFPGRTWVRAAATVPIVSMDGTVGVFLILSDRDTAFSSRRMEAVRTFAGIVALEIHNRRRVSTLLDERADAATMLELSKQLSRYTNEDALLGAIVAHCRSVSDASFAIAWTLRGNLFESAAIDGAGAEFAETVKFNADATMPLGQSPEGRAARGGAIETVKDTEADRTYAAWQPAARRFDVRSILALPLHTSDGAPVVVGLYAAHVDAFGEKIIAHLRAYAEHGRVALTTARAFAAAAEDARAKSMARSVGSGVTHNLDLGEVARSIARVAGEACDASFAVTYVKDRDTLSIAGEWNAPPNLSIPVTLNAADPAMATYPPVAATRERRIIAYEDVTTDAQWLRQGWEQQALADGFNAVVAVPLIDERPSGAVVLFFTGAPIVREGDSTRLVRLGADGAAAIEAARRFTRAKSARDFLNRVLEESTDAIVQIDLGGMVVGWNAGAERIFGLSRDEAIGAGFADMAIVPHANREDVREMFSRVARGETVRALEIVSRNRTGEPVDMLLSATPSRDEDGNIVGVVAFSKDITEQKKQFAELAGAHRRLTTIREITRAFTREIGVSAVAQKALDRLLETQRLDAGRVYVLDREESRLYNVAQRGFSVDGTSPIDVRPATTGSEGMLSTCVYYRQTMVFNDVEGQRLEHPHFADRNPADVSAIVTTPLANGDAVVGAIQVVGFDDRRLSFDDVGLLHAVTDELASAIHGAQLLEEASRMAITDPLTGLYNYRFAHDFLKKRLSEARRRRRPFSVIMADVDGLMAVNERFGRAVGDEVLKQFGRCLASCVRLSDVVARYGGDEFIVLLPETQLGDALMLAERMGQAFAGFEWERPAEDLELSASMGCAAFPESGSHTQMLLKAADAALYQAKKFGRNSIYPRTDSLPKFAG